MITPPPGYEHMTLDEVRAHFRQRLDERVAAIHEQRRAEGRPPPSGASAFLASGLHLHRRTDVVPFPRENGLRRLT